MERDFNLPDLCRVWRIFVYSMISFICALVGWAAAAIAYGDMYRQEQLLKDRPRLKKAVEGIYNKGLVPVLGGAERRALAETQIEIPLPKNGDDLLNFYAVFRGGRPIVVMPLLSLKVMEDTTTAYAWLTKHKHDLGMIELYMTMTRYRAKSKYPGGVVPPILDALGIPADALKDPEVDRKSLKMRNEAFAFILAHELGHIRFRHKGYGEISKAQARADEMQSDQFAMTLLERTGTAPVGGFLFFQSQIYRLPHRGEYASEAEWQDHLQRYSTHPLSTKRLIGISDYIERWARKGVRGERVMKTAIALGFKQFARYLSNQPLQKCMVRVARQAPIDVLKPGGQLKGLVLKHCRGILQ